MERRMFARLEHGRSVQNDTDYRRGGYFKGVSRVVMMRSYSGGSATELSATDA
jgi:hypothetical protein